MIHKMEQKEQVQFSIKTFPACAFACAYTTFYNHKIP